MIRLKNTSLGLLMRSLYKIIFFLSIASIGSAADIYSMVLRDCREVRGFIINVDDTKVYVLDEKGTQQALARQDIQNILIYKINESPIAKISTSAYLTENIRDVYVGDSATPALSGWPVGFLDNLILFLDYRGRIHILDQNQINKIRNSQTTYSDYQKTNVNSLSYSWGDLPLSCAHVDPTSASSVKPSRVLIDLIHVQDFLSTTEKSFDRYHNFESRTYFYARPYLFDRETRMGLGSLDTKDQLAYPSIFYFQWATGEPYATQSLGRIGFADYDESPSISNPFSFYSVVKSHLFHGTFLGNLSGISAGSSYYTNYRDAIDNKINTKVLSYSTYNYIALMGFDYLNYSFSFGTSHPIYFVNAKTYYREILASNVSPIFEIKYQNKFLTTGLVYQSSSYASNNVNDNEVSADPNISVIGQIKNFTFDAKLVRMNLMAALSESFRAGGSLILSQGHYNETMSGVVNDFKYNNTTAMAHVVWTFGQYISAHGYWTLYKSDQDVSTQTLVDHANGNSNSTTGGVLEFIF